MARTLTQITADLHARRATARRYDAGLNEGGEGYNPHHPALQALEAAYAAARDADAQARRAAAQAADEAVWTLELTTARRAEWNAWVKSQGKRITPAHLAARLQAQGWSVDALKAAIKRHGL